MKIIPAIDIIDGKCVRLTQGDYSKKTIYTDNPVEIAKNFENHGIKYIHIVDLDGAKSSGIINYKVIESIAKKTNLIIDFGGGIKSLHDLKIAFESGASQITVGSIASKNPKLFLEWFKIYGPEKIILGADCINGKIATDGWQETSETDVIDFLKFYQEKGLKTTICTDISKDGMLQGISQNLYENIIQNTEFQLIASGGVSSINDLEICKNINCFGVIIGKALYENKITLKELENYIYNN